MPTGHPGRPPGPRDPRLWYQPHGIPVIRPAVFTVIGGVMLAAAYILGSLNLHWLVQLLVTGPIEILGFLVLLLPPFVVNSGILYTRIGKEFDNDLHHDERVPKKLRTEYEREGKLFMARVTRWFIIGAVGLALTAALAFVPGVGSFMSRVTFDLLGFAAIPLSLALGLGFTNHWIAAARAAPAVLGICPACGRDLAGDPDTGPCPNCGRPYDKRRRRKKRTAADVAGANPEAAS